MLAQLLPPMSLTNCLMMDVNSRVKRARKNLHREVMVQTMGPGILGFSWRNRGSCGFSYLFSKLISLNFVFLGLYLITLFFERGRSVTKIVAE